jgi:hypothetical protein
MERVTMTFTDRELETVLVVFTMRPTIVRVVGERNFFSAYAAVIVPIVYATGSQAWHDEVVEHVAVCHGFGGVLQAFG